MERDNLLESYQAVLDGERKYLPRGVWGDIQIARENFKILFGYLVEDYLHLTQEQVLCTVDRSFFQEYGLRGGLITAYGEDIYKAVDDYYGVNIPRWKFKQVPKNYWKENNVSDVVKEIAKEYNILSMDDLYRITPYEMERNGMTKISRLKSHKPYCLSSIAKLLFPNQPYEPIRFSHNANIKLKMA